nr:MAG TPA: hypothetical protein [Caudoviricetes sp.]
MYLRHQSKTGRTARAARTRVKSRNWRITSACPWTSCWNPAMGSKKMPRPMLQH